MFCKTPKPSELSLLRRKRRLSPSWGGGCGTGGRACSGPPRSFPGSLKPMTPGPPDLCGTVARWFSLLSHLFTTTRQSQQEQHTTFPACPAIPAEPRSFQHAPRTPRSPGMLCYPGRLRTLPAVSACQFSSQTLLTLQFPERNWGSRQWGQARRLCGLRG